MKETAGLVGGIVYAVLGVLGIFLLVSDQVDEMTGEEILSHYAESGTRSTEIVGFILVTIGAMFLLWFLATLRSRLAAVEAEPKALFAVAFGAGVAAAALLITSAAMLASTSLAVELVDAFEVDPSLALWSVSTGYLLLVGFVLVGCALVLATSVLALHSADLPSWLGWLGFAAVVLAIIEAVLLPVFVIPVWVLVVSVVVMLQSRKMPTTVHESPAP